MKNLYQVTLERTTYHGQKSIETRELFATSPKDINTYRLGGFQRDTITILKTKKIRSRNTIELDVDIERNEISASVDVLEHLDTTLDYNKVLTQTVRRIAKKEGKDIEEVLEENGWTELSADNTYNYSSDFDNNLNFKVYSLNPDTDSIYGKDLIVLVKMHQGLDVRGGYKFMGLYNGLKHDGLCYFYDMHVRVTVETMDGEHEADFDGDWSFGSMLKEYKIKSWDGKTQKLIVSKDNQDFQVRWYHPAEGF